MRRLVEHAIRLGVAFGLPGSVLMLSSCSASPEGLSEEVAAEPGVIEVQVFEDSGDGDIPFQAVPHRVAVEMAGNATEAEVLRVFDKYSEEMASGEVTAVEVSLKGYKPSTLAVGEGVPVARDDVRALLRAHDDEEVLEYRHEAYAVSPSIRVSVSPTDFHSAVALADEYQDSTEIEILEFSSGGLALVRDADEDSGIYPARERLVRRLDSRFAVRQAVVAGSGSLEIGVARGQVAAARELVSRLATDAVGTVVVSAG